MNTIQISLPLQLLGESYRLTGVLERDKGITVQRDMNLIREILLKVQGKEGLKPEPVYIDGYEREVLDRHIYILYSEGFLEGNEAAGFTNHYSVIWVKDLTWSGHDFAGALKKEEIWENIKSILDPRELAELSLQQLKKLALDLSERWLRKKFGFEE